MAALQRQPHAATAAGSAAVSVEAFEKLASNTQSLQKSLSALAQQMHTSHGRTGINMPCSAYRMHWSSWLASVLAESSNFSILSVQ